MTRDLRVYIEDILECVAKIKEYTGRISENEFYENTQVQDAVLRRLEIIGEAVKRSLRIFETDTKTYRGKKLQE